MQVRHDICRRPEVALLCCENDSEPQPSIYPVSATPVVVLHMTALCFAPADVVLAFVSPKIQAVKPNSRQGAPAEADEDFEERFRCVSLGAAAPALLHMAHEYDQITTMCCATTEPQHSYASPHSTH